jgi:predicted lipoprotein with Yx(FWY)xxD motif
MGPESEEVAVARRFRLSLVSFAIVLVSACGSSSKSSSSSSGTTAASPTTAYSYGGATSATSAAASATVLKTAMNATLHQNIVVDDNGKTVYTYKPDGTSTTSKVPAGLKAAWPAVTSMESTPTVAAGLSNAKTKVNAQDQVSYDGHLLYTFSADTKPGDAKGQGLGNVWYMISPTGAPIT